LPSAALDGVIDFYLKTQNQLENLTKKRQHDSCETEANVSEMQLNLDNTPTANQLNDH
jgi:hypothetical protein